MSRVRVEIDLNARNAEGLTVTKLRNVSGDIREGQVVTAFESEDAVQALAMVSRVDRTDGYVYLHVNWDSMREDDGVEVTAPAYSTVANRAQAAVENRHAMSSGAASVRRRPDHVGLTARPERNL